jgi:hypothetical protein
VPGVARTFEVAATICLPGIDGVPWKPFIAAAFSSGEMLQMGVGMIPPRQSPHPEVKVVAAPPAIVVSGECPMALRLGRGACQLFFNSGTPQGRVDFPLGCKVAKRLQTATPWLHPKQLFCGCQPIEKWLVTREGTRVDHFVRGACLAGRKSTETSTSETAGNLPS